MSNPACLANMFSYSDHFFFKINNYHPLTKL